MDNLKYCRTVENDSIDLIYFNPPFATTGNSWDNPLDWVPLFVEMNRILKPDGNIVIHCSVPFTYDLIRFKKPKYHWVWDKGVTGNPFIAKKQPMRNTEEILVYHKDGYSGRYFPQMEGTEERTVRMKKCSTTYWRGGQRTKDYVNTIIGRYPRHLLRFKLKVDGLSTRPMSLIEYIVKTYTKEGDMVLDLTAYKGITGKVCDTINREYVGVDIRDWK